MTSGYRRLFQVSINSINDAVTNTAFMFGIYILKNIAISLKPSIRAALINSTGNSFEFCLKRYIKNGSDNETSIIVKRESKILNALSIINKGMTKTDAGIIIEKKDILNKLSIVLLRKTIYAYPAKEARVTPINTVITVTMMEFFNAITKLPSLINVLKLLTKLLVERFVKISPLLISTEVLKEEKSIRK